MIAHVVSRGAGLHAPQGQRQYVGYEPLRGRYGGRAADAPCSPPGFCPGEAGEGDSSRGGKPDLNCRGPLHLPGEWRLRPDTRHHTATPPLASCCSALTALHMHVHVLTVVPFACACASQSAPNRHAPGHGEMFRDGSLTFPNMPRRCSSSSGPGRVCQLSSPHWYTSEKVDHTPPQYAEHGQYFQYAQYEQYRIDGLV